MALKNTGQNSRTALVVQARLGSTRLPGKVLLDLAGRPLIAQIFKQALGSRYELIPVLTCSTDPRDDELVRFAESEGMAVFRGPADDIIGRLHGSANLAGADAIVRVWGDCPFVCPDVIDAMLDRFYGESLDFLSNGGDERNMPVGLDAELYRASFLASANENVKEAFLREFPFQYLVSLGDKVNWGLYRAKVDFPVLHLTVDYPEDLEAARAIYARLYEENRSFLHEELYALLSAEPGLVDRFSHGPRQADFIEKLKAFKHDGKG